MNVEQCMTRNPLSCRAGDSLERAAQIMWEGDCGCVPVIDGGSKLIGMITDRDICMAAYTRGAPLHALSVESAMARGVVGCRASDTLETALGLLSSNRLRRLPVVDAQGGLVGIVTLLDMARQSRVPGRTRSGRLAADDVVSALNGIGRPGANRTTPEVVSARPGPAKKSRRSVLKPRARPGGSKPAARSR
jgi:CBS domain-containing protein